MRLILVVLVSVWISGCEEAISPSKIDPNSLLSTSDVDSINVILAGFDKVRITHKLGSTVTSQQFIGVTVGVMQSGTFHPIGSSVSEFDPRTDAYSFDFDFLVLLDSSAIQSEVVTRYIKRDSSHTDVVSLVDQLTYPYEHSLLYLTNSIMVHRSHFQDVAFWGTRFFHRPTGGEGIYEYNPETQLSRRLVNIGGDQLAADSGYVFADFAPSLILRYNLTTDTTDLIIQRPADSDVRGLATHGGFLYVLDEGPIHKLVKYTYDGTPVDSTEFPWTGFHLTIDNDVLYTGTYTSIIRRFQFPSLVELSTVSSPARELEGIKIHNGRMYYCDYFKNVVASVPILDLQQFAVTSTRAY